MRSLLVPSRKRRHLVTAMIPVVVVALSWALSYSRMSVVAWRFHSGEIVSLAISRGDLEIGRYGPCGDLPHVLHFTHFSTLPVKLTPARGGLDLSGYLVPSEWSMAYRPVQRSYRFSGAIGFAWEVGSPRYSLWRGGVRAVSGNDRLFILLPVWAILPVAGLPLILCCVSAFRSSRRVARKYCVFCGYDLSATPSRCPECGAVCAEQSNSGKDPCTPSNSTQR